MSKCPFITEEQMNTLTEEILAKSGIPFEWTGTVARIDIDNLIEFRYGIEIVWDNIDNLADDGIVLAAISPKEKKIYLNESQKELFSEKMGTMNFTKAHELGHWVLHVTEQQDYKQLDFAETYIYHCRNNSNSNPQEKQADMFASAILMPKAIITQAINELRQNGEIKFPHLYALADKFEVSISALTVRLSKLNLLYIAKDKKIYNSKEEAMGQIAFM